LLFYGEKMSNRNVFLLLAAVVLTVVLQTSFLPVYTKYLFKPDILLVIMVAMSLKTSYVSGSALAWSLGLLKDVFCGLFLGLNAFTFLVIFFIIKSMTDRIYAESGYLFLCIVAAATTACLVINLSLLVMFTKTPTIAYSLLYGFIPHLLFNMFCASLLVLAPFFDFRGEME